MMDEYRIAKRLSYIGKQSKKAGQQYNKKYGKDNWKIGWKWGEDILSREEALNHYETSYVEYFRNNPERLNWLLERASDVYDIAPSDVHSGYDYNKQQGKAFHLQDIAIRRAVRDLGEEFRGDHLVQVRQKDCEGVRFNPGIIPFYKPEMIESPKAKGWWKATSIEGFWQSNKVLLVLDEDKTGNK